MFGTQPGQDLKIACVSSLHLSILQITNTLCPDIIKLQHILQLDVESMNKRKMLKPFMINNIHVILDVCMYLHEQHITPGNPAWIPKLTLLLLF